LKPLSTATASVTMIASGPSCAASRSAPTTFAPVETPAKHAFFAREACRHRDRLGVVDRVDAVQWLPHFELEEQSAGPDATPVPVSV
jgi:hypothetical protein